MNKWEVLFLLYILSIGMMFLFVMYLDYSWVSHIVWLIGAMLYMGVGIILGYYIKEMIVVNDHGLSSRVGWLVLLLFVSGLFGIIGYVCYEKLEKKLEGKE